MSQADPYDQDNPVADKRREMAALSEVKDLQWLMSNKRGRRIVWRMLVSGNTKTFQYADGNLNFDNVWDNRTALTYL